LDSFDVVGLGGSGTPFAVADQFGNASADQPGLEVALQFGQVLAASSRLRLRAMASSASSSSKGPMLSSRSTIVVTGPNVSIAVA
jgi:hypothetical protein